MNKNWCRLISSSGAAWWGPSPIDWFIHDARWRIVFQRGVTFEQTFRKTNAVHSMPPISDSVRRKIVAIPSAILEERVDDDAAGTRSVDGRVVSNDTVFRSRIRLVHREKKKKKTLKTALRIPFGYGKRTFKLKIIAESETFGNRRTSADTPVLLLFRIPHTPMRFLVKIDTVRGWGGGLMFDITRDRVPY